MLTSLPNLSRLHILAQHLSRPRIKQWLVFASLGIGIVIVMAAVWLADSSREAAIDNAVREMRNDALLLAEQENRLLQSIDLIHLSVIAHMRELKSDSADAFPKLAGTIAFQRYLSERVAGLSYISALMVFDANGTLLNSSRSWPPPSVDSSDRDYIRAQIATWLPQPFLGRPLISTTTGNWTAFISRRFDGPDGRLAGILVGAIPLNYFEHFYSRLPLTGGGAYVLYRRDGTLMARYPKVEGKVGQNYRTTANFSQIIAAIGTGSVRLVSTMDGQDRILGHTGWSSFR